MMFGEAIAVYFQMELMDTLCEQTLKHTVEIITVAL
jgi:hypothetical protein